MRKILFVLAILAAFVVAPASAQVTNVATAWVDGNLVFYDASGNIILTIDGTNRKLTLPSGSTLDATTTAMSGLTASRLVVSSAAKALASNAAITTNALAKSASSGASLAASSITDDGSDVTLTATDLAVGGGDIDAGASGAAGSVDIFPSTASKGKIAITAADSAGNTTTTIVNASQAGARTYTIPDAGASTDFVLVTNKGTATSGAATAAESLEGVHRTVITLAVTGDYDVDLADGDHGGGQQVYTFPEGQIAILGAVLDSTVTNTTNFNADPNDEFSFGIGTATAGDDNALSSTEQNIIAVQTVDTAAGVTTTRAEDVVGPTTAVYVDGTASAAGLFVNFAVADTDNSDTNALTCTGTLTVIWAHLGDK